MTAARATATAMKLLPSLVLVAACNGGGAGGGSDGGGLPDGGDARRSQQTDVRFDPPEVGLDGGAYVPVPGTCGFDPAPAFCDTFEQGPMAGGRAGELDPARWSAVRSAGIDTAFGGGIGKAQLPQCRPGLTDALVLPDGDTVICDPTPAVPTRHLLTATAAQNYGLNTYRIRQPFDFAGRTGTIKLDVDLTNGGLFGWPAIAIAEDPSPTPSFDFPERGSGPRNGLEIEFMGGWCNTPMTVTPTIYFYSDYKETAAPETVPPASFDCGIAHVTTSPGALNHVEIYLTRTRIEVWASDASPDGVTFPNFQRLYAGTLDLPFDRAYVSLIGRNHATIKYGHGPSWTVRWDNVGFDGPAVSGWREASVPDSLQPADDGEALTTGYVVPSAEAGESLRLDIPSVSVAGATSARLALSVQYPWFEWNGVHHPPTYFNLRHRLNGGPWHDRHVNDIEANAFASFSGDAGAEGAGLLSQIIDLDVTELREGGNVLELAGANVWTGSYRIGVVGVDLLLTIGR
jgi:hypothetical protein